MRILPVLLASVALLSAHEHPPAGAAGETPLERLFSERESKDKFAAAKDAAKDAGVTDQAILEATFLFHVDRHEDDAIAALLPEFTRQAERFNLEQSEIFSTTEDWLAVCEYVKAIAALKNNDKADFKKHITEAFWLSPRQGAAFAPHIDRLRLDEAMGAIHLDFAAEYTALDPAEPIPLSRFTTGRKALLLHFWSPWSRECEESMDDFTTTAAELLKKDIAVVSILPENSPDVLADARELIKTLGDSPPGAWLVDKKQSSLNRLLRVQSVPTFVLAAADGSILFNGHPTDSSFWDALIELDPAITRPESHGDHEEP